MLLSASRRRDIDAVISVSAFAHPRWMMQRFLRRAHLPGPLVTLVMRYVEWVIGVRYDAIAPIHTVCRIRCPVLLVYSPRVKSRFLECLDRSVWQGGKVPLYD